MQARVETRITARSIEIIARVFKTRFGGLDIPILHSNILIHCNLRTSKTQVEGCGIDAGHLIRLANIAVRQDPNQKPG